MWNILLFFKLTPASFYFYSSQYGNHLNEKKFEKWVKLSDGGRKYFYDVVGRHGWRARYVKEVDSNENTLKFYQEIYNEFGKLVEVHEKFPIDMGHKKINRGT